MLQKYQYKYEMEEAIWDMFLLGFGINSTRPMAIADWSGYNMGLAVSLSLSVLAGDRECNCLHEEDAHSVHQEFVHVWICRISEIRLRGDSTEG